MNSKNTGATWGWSGLIVVGASALFWGAALPAWGSTLLWLSLVLAAGAQAWRWQQASQATQAQVNALTQQLQRNEAELQQQVAYADTILSKVHSGLVVVDHAGHIQDCNQALLKMTGFGRDALMGQASSSLFEDDEAKTLSILKGYGQMLTRLGVEDPAGYAQFLDGSLLGGPGMLIVASTIGARAIAPLGAIVTQWRQVVAAREAYQRLDKWLTQYPPKSKGMALPEPIGVLSVEALVASAPNSNTPILRGLQFAVKPGNMLAVIGPSGSGKTTLARLLVGVWPAMSGKVRLDGADVFSWHKTELGQYMGYVPQTVTMPEGTVAQNISRFETTDTPEEAAQQYKRLQAAAQALDLHEILRALPQGYDTPMGADGHIFSGGQLQRMAIARAIYGQPKLLVLDEANSHLDQQGEADLAQLLTQLKQQNTTLVVMTHRKALLALADQVLVLKDGTQQLYGPKDDVLAKLGVAL